MMKSEMRKGGVGGADRARLEQSTRAAVQRTHSGGKSDLQSEVTFGPKPEKQKMIFFVSNVKAHWGTQTHWWCFSLWHIKFILFSF